MKVLALYGSPRLRGFSSELHDIFLNSFIEKGFFVKKVHVYDKEINPCTACGLCKKENRCSFNDDMVSIYNEIETADFITVSSPVYFSSFPGPLKNLFDRCELLWERRLTEKRPNKAGAFLILTGGSDYTKMFYPSITVLKHLLNSIGISFTEDDTFLVSGTDEFVSLPEEIKVLAKKRGKEYSAFLEQHNTT